MEEVVERMQNHFFLLIYPYPSTAHDVPHEFLIIQYHHLLRNYILLSVFHDSSHLVEQLSSWTPPPQCFHNTKEQVHVTFWILERRKSKKMHKIWVSYTSTSFYNCKSTFIPLMLTLAGCWATTQRRATPLVELLHFLIDEEDKNLNYEFCEAITNWNR